MAGDLAFHPRFEAARLRAGGAKVKRERPLQGLMPSSDQPLHRARGRATFAVMKSPIHALPVLVLLALSACVAPTGPVEVTRFHVPAATRLAQGSVAIEPAQGMDGQSLEFRTYAEAVSRELQRVGYAEMVAGGASSQSVAVVRIERESFRRDSQGSPVSVGIGGGTGGYGSGVGLGLGLNLSGPPPEMVETRLFVTIRDRASGQSLWEGRASFSARSSSPLAQTQLGAAKLAEALFRGFPGNSGETILVE
jgi:hypothetical protein